MNLRMPSAHTVARLLWSFDVRDAEEFRYPATVSIWFRWVILAACLVEVSYRVEYGALSHILNTLYLLGMMAANGYVWWRIRAKGAGRAPLAACP